MSRRGGKSPEGKPRPRGADSVRSDLRGLKVAEKWVGDLVTAVMDLQAQRGHL